MVAASSGVKKIPDILKMVPNKVVKTANIMKKRQLNSIIFSSLCDKLSTSYATLLLHMEFPCLTQERVLDHVNTTASKTSSFSVNHSKL
jgi:hypothetical protein